MRRLSVLLALLSLTCLGCGHRAAVSQGSPDHATPVAAHGSDSPCTLAWVDTEVQLAAGGASVPVQLDDRKIAGVIEAAGAMMIDKKKTTAGAELRKQLERKTCKLALPKPGDKAMAAHEMYEKLRPSVAVVAGVYKCGKCDRWHGAPASGFAITEDVLVTNYHVIAGDNRETFVAYVNNGKVYPVKEVLAASKGDDIAIIRLDMVDGGKLTPIALQADAPVGTDVCVISHPARRFYTLTRGIVSRYFTMNRKGARNVPTVMITADYARGSSGAPVLNARGAAVAMVASTNSVYYEENGEQQKNLQMVFKQCVPVKSVLKLIDTD